MGQTLATLTPILKEVYEGGLETQLNNEAKAWNRVERNAKASKKFGGKYVNFPIHVGRNSGIGSRNENEALPVAGFQDTRELTVPMKYHYAAVELTGQTIELASTDYQSFAKSIDLEVNGVKDDISKERNRQFFGDGSGSKAVTSAAPAAGTPQDIPVSSAKQIDFNGVYDVMVGATSTIRQAALLVTNVVGNTVTVTGTTTGIAAGDIWVRTGSYGREWTGIAAVLSDTTTLQGLDPAQNPTWKAVVNNNGDTSTAISELMLIRMADKIYENGGRTSVIFTTLGVQRAYFSLLESKKRFVNTQKFEGGFSGVAFGSASQGEIPMIADIDAPAGQALFLSEKDLTLYTNGEYKFMDRSGSMWQQKRTSAGKFDAWEATLYQYSEMATHRRNSQGVIRNITEDVSL